MKTIKINVTKKNIDDSKSGYACFNCPIARAFNDLGYQARILNTGPYDSSIVKDGIRYSLLMSKKAMNFITTLDGDAKRQFNKIKPSIFVIKVTGSCNA